MPAPGMVVWDSKPVLKSVKGRELGQEQEVAGERRPKTEGLDANVLLTQFGQAMARVGQLEHLCRNQEQRIAELEQKLELADAARSARPEQSAPDIEANIRQRDATIESLRVQLMTAQSELARTKEKLKMAAEGAYVRHRHHRRRWWRFWK